MSAATSGAAAADASRASRRARVRRESTSSTVRAISDRAAYTTSACEYGKTGDDRLGERRARRAATRAPRARRRRSASRARSAAWPGPSPTRRAAARASCGSRRRPATSSSFTATSTVSAAMRRYVVSLPPVTVITPLADALTEWRRERSAVRSLLAARTSGRRPAHVPRMSASVIVVVTAPLIARSR